MSHVSDPALGFSHGLNCGTQETAVYQSGWVVIVIIIHLQSHVRFYVTVYVIKTRGHQLSSPH